jgi:hypothetical protein
MLYEDSLWWISHCPECTNQLPYISVTRPEYHQVEQLIDLCYSSCHGNAFVNILCRGNVITEPLLTNGRLLRLHHSGFRPSCHNIICSTSVNNGFCFRTLKLSSYCQTDVHTWDIMYSFRVSAGTVVSKVSRRNQWSATRQKVYSQTKRLLQLQLHH